MKCIGRVRPERCQVRAALRVAFVGVVLGGQGLRPFAGEPSGGRGGPSGGGVVARGAGVERERQGASKGRGDRVAARGLVRLGVVDG